MGDNGIMAIFDKVALKSDNFNLKADIVKAFFDTPKDQARRIQALLG